MTWLVSRAKLKVKTVAFAELMGVLTGRPANAVIKLPEG